MEVPHLLRDLPRNLIGAHGVFIWLLAEAKVEAREDEREGNTRPHEQESHHGSEGHLRKEGGREGGREGGQKGRERGRGGREGGRGGGTVGRGRLESAQERTYCSRRVLAPDEEVEQKAHPKHHTRVEGSCLQGKGIGQL